MDLRWCASLIRRRQRGVQRPARVDDEQIARREPAWQIEEARVLDRVGVDVGDQQPHVVTPEAARFGRLTRLEVRRQLEPGAHTRCSHRASSCCAANRSPLTLAGSWSNSQFQNGAVTEGSGRSEMSAPGNASWCMRVRMSPGSTMTADTPSPRSSAASVFVSSSSAALLAPYGPQPGYAACAASLVMLTTRPRRWASSEAARWISAIGAPALTGKTRPKRC